MTYNFIDKHEAADLLNNQRRKRAKAGRYSCKGQISLDIRECLSCEALFIPNRRQTQSYCSQMCQKQDKKIKPAVIERIQAERAKGKAFKQIAKELGLSVGSVHHYANTIDTQVSKQRKSHTLIAPWGKTIHVPPRHLAKFCRYFELRYDCINHVIAGRQVQHKGWLNHRL